MYSGVGIHVCTQFSVQDTWVVLFGENKKQNTTEIITVPSDKKRTSKVM